MISFCLQTVLCVQFDLELSVSGSHLLLCAGAVCSAGYAVSLHRGEEADILGPEGCWGPDVLLWSHPRRCPSLWAFSQVSASGSLLYLDLQLNGQKEIKWCCNQTADHIQISLLIEIVMQSCTINCVDNLMSSLLSGLSDVSSPMPINLLSESCLGLQEPSLERPQSHKNPVASN